MVRAEAATTTPRPSFGLLVERESHDSTEIAKDERPTRTSSEGDSGEGEGCRRPKENSERTKGEMEVGWGVGGYKYRLLHVHCGDIYDRETPR